MAYSQIGTKQPLFVWEMVGGQKSDQSPCVAPSNPMFSPQLTPRISALALTGDDDVPKFPQSWPSTPPNPVFSQSLVKSFHPGIAYYTTITRSWKKSELLAMF